MSDDPASPRKGTLPAARSGMTRQQRDALPAVRRRLVERAILTQRTLRARAERRRER